MLKKYRILALLLVLFLTSCGTLMHPERKGQFVHDKKLDLSVTLLNASTIFIFPPLTLVAFVVDASNKTLFLPADEVLLYKDTPKNKAIEREQERILREEEKLRQAELEQQKEEMGITEEPNPEDEFDSIEDVEDEDGDLFS